MEQSSNVQSGLYQIEIILEICRNRIFWLIKIAPDFFVALPKYPKSVILVNMHRS